MSDNIDTIELKFHNVKVGDSVEIPLKSVFSDAFGKVFCIQAKVISVTENQFKITGGDNVHPKDVEFYGGVIVNKNGNLNFKINGKIVPVYKKGELQKYNLADSGKLTLFNIDPNCWEGVEYHLGTF